MKGKYFGLLLALSVALLVYLLFLNFSRVALPPAEEYEAALPGWQVSKVASDLGFITRLKLSNDGKLLFVTTLDGQLHLLTKKGGRFIRQENPLFKLELGFAPGVENGLTGLVLSNQFPTNPQLFLLYARKISASEKQNEILRLTLKKENGTWLVQDQALIYQGATPTDVAHQIQGGVSLMIEDKPHLLFTVGDAFFHPEYAPDLTKEAGKFILIQENGESPLGERPYPEFPRIQAVGIRNVYDLALDPTNRWIYFTQNGPDKNDTIVYAPLLDPSLKFNFNWSGNGTALLKPLVNEEAKPEYIIYSWEVTVAPVDIIAYGPGQFVFNIFSTDRSPKKEMVLGQLKNGGQAELQVLVRRREGVEGGNLLGLESDSKNELYFGDPFDGAIYFLHKT